MKSRVILSALGSDRPGLTQALADAVFAAGGNWLESRLSRLGGKYVGAVLVEVDAGDLPALRTAIAAVDSAGLHVSIVAAGDAPSGPGDSATIELVGQDRPGIVRELTGALSGIGVNIEDFATATENTAWSGGRLFRVSARIVLPRGVTPDRVRAALEEISGEIMVDFTVSSGDARPSP